MKDKIRKALRAWLYPELEGMEWQRMYEVWKLLDIKSDRRRITAEDIILVGDLKNCTINITPKYDLDVKVEPSSMLHLAGNQHFVGDCTFSMEGEKK